jgi:hypothetical protein
MKAIQEAQQYKHLLEQSIRQELIAFTESTGMVVSALKMHPIETTAHDDDYPKFGDYSVQITLNV